MSEETRIYSSPVVYLTELDEKIFFWGLEQIDCLKIDEKGYLVILHDKVTLESLINLASLLYRFKAVNMHELAQFFKPEDLKAINKRCWYNEIFKNKKPSNL